MVDTWLYAVIPASVVLGYSVGRLRPGQRLDSWAGSKVDGRHGVGWWVAQAVMAVEICWAVTVHPRRTRANLRTWHEARRAPAPVFDSQWIKRKDSSDA